MGRSEKKSVNMIGKWRWKPLSSPHPTVQSTSCVLEFPAWTGRGFLLRKLQRCCVSEENLIWARKWVWPVSSQRRKGGGITRQAETRQRHRDTAAERPTSRVSDCLCFLVQPSCNNMQHAATLAAIAFPPRLYRLGLCLRTDVAPHPSSLYFSPCWLCNGAGRREGGKK